MAFPQFSTNWISDHSSLQSLNNFWDSQRCSFDGRISNNGLGFSLNTDSIIPIDCNLQAVVQSRSPLSMTAVLCYFEVSLHKLPPHIGYVAVGISEEKFELQQLPGWPSQQSKSLSSSYGYHSDGSFHQGNIKINGRSKRRVVSGSGGEKTRSFVTTDPVTMSDTSLCSSLVSPITSPRNPSAGIPSNSSQPVPLSYPSTSPSPPRCRLHKGQLIFPRVQEGDTIGVLLNNCSHQLFFTLNGKLLPVDLTSNIIPSLRSSSPQDNIYGSFFPTVGLRLESTKGYQDVGFDLIHRKKLEISIKAQFQPNFLYDFKEFGGSSKWLTEQILPGYLPLSLHSPLLTSAFPSSGYLPTRWDSQRTSEVVSVSADGSILSYHPKSRSIIGSVVVVRTNEPFYPASISPPLQELSQLLHPSIRYIEVTILSYPPKTNISFGLCRSHHPCTNALIPPAYPAIADYRAVSALVEAAKAYQAGHPEYSYVTGICHTIGHFYDGPLGNTNQLWANANVLSQDMELACLFVQSSLYKEAEIIAGGIVSIDNLILATDRNDSSSYDLYCDQVAKAKVAMIPIALDALISLYQHLTK